MFELKLAKDDLGQVSQAIIRRNEQPAHEQTYVLPIDNPMEAKIFVIDSGEYSTMLFAENYWGKAGQVEAW